VFAAAAAAAATASGNETNKLKYKKDSDKNNAWHYLCSSFLCSLLASLYLQIKPCLNVS
jgi:hypothetical protein